MIPDTDDSRQVRELSRVALPLAGCADIVLQAHIDGARRPPVRATVHGLERNAVVVLPYDPVADVVVLIEQLRPGAWAAGGTGWVIEAVAGLIDAGETPEQAAAKELEEEIQCRARRLLLIRRYLPNPVDSAVQIWQYCALIDASAVPTVAGVAEEGEYLRVHRTSAADLPRLLDDPRLANAATLLSLQWLALHRESLRNALAGEAAIE